ncbi:hypothetical protein LP419_32650 [Massilia sp. H-1]|nr:hypothetical protein LP419_32650 [Massilia sp. H-1]
MIGEIYVPRALVDFMGAAAADFRLHGVDLIYGTIRLIERDDESFLPWARQDYACVIFNLHTRHTEAGIEATMQAFRRLIDLATARGGSYYLTYSKAATIAQARPATRASTSSSTGSAYSTRKNASRATGTVTTAIWPRPHRRSWPHEREQGKQYGAGRRSRTAAGHGYAIARAFDAA